MIEAVLTPTEMFRADALADAAGVPPDQLMQAAGRAVARAVRQFRPVQRMGRVLVLCGPGNNGGDGYVAARLLEQDGWPVAVAALDNNRWLGVRVPFTPGEAARAEIVIDAVFGAGLRGPVPDPVADTLAAAHRVLAIELPSGLDGATGQPRGRVRAAELTITFFRLKPGHLLLPGRTLCGRVILADIGLPPSVIDTIRPQTFRNTPALWTLPQPGAASHKYARGHLTVLGGAMTGAARMAADAGRRVGAGLVSIASAAPHAYDAAPASIIVTGRALADLAQDVRANAWVVGPGLGIDAARAALPLLAGRLIVADADALHGPAEALAGCAVLTPHEGEFTRLFGPPGPDKLAAVRAAAQRVGAVVLLKGADTVIAAPDGRAAINDNAPPWLATAGAGDVLAGTIGGLLAQGMPAWKAACAGVWLHGRAAQLAGPGLLADTLPENITRACLEQWITP